MSSTRPKPDRPSHKIDTHKVFPALAWLKDNNPLYANVVINSTYPDNTSDLHEPMEITEEVTYKDVSFIPTNYVIPLQNRALHTNKKHAAIPNSGYTLPYITEQPINIFQHPSIEEWAFPNLYPYGTHGFQDAAKSFTLKQYFTFRVTNLDTRWSSSVSNLFWALNVYEQHQLQSCISIALRLETTSSDELQAHNVLTNDYQQHVAEDFRLMKSMKGTAAYWREQLYDLIAKMSILGPPTFLWQCNL